MLAIQGSI